MFHFVVYRTIYSICSCQKQFYMLLIYRQLPQCEVLLKYMWDGVVSYCVAVYKYWTFALPLIRYDRLTVNECVCVCMCVLCMCVSI